MHRKALVAMTAIGLTAAIAIPTIAFGNARRDFGTLRLQKIANTPLIAKMLGTNGVGTGDLDGFGVAVVTIDMVTVGVATIADVCWDLRYSNISAPTLAHIHQGGPDVNGPIVIPFTLGPPPNAGCIQADPVVAQQILDAPQNFYVNVHTTDFKDGAIRGQLAAGPPPAGDSHMLPSPLRAYDSRDNAGPKLAPDETRTISLAEGKDSAGNSVIALPPGATAAIVTLTVTETVAPGGFVKLYSAALADPPPTSSINWAGTDQNLAVSTQVAVDATGSVKITGGAESTHVIIDVIGYTF